MTCSFALPTKLALFLFSGICAAQTAGLTQRPVYVGRELQSRPQERMAALSRYSSDARGRVFDSQLKIAYESIEPGRSLLIHDCYVMGQPSWCKNPVFSFGSIFSKAAGMAGLKPTVASHHWLVSSKKLIPDMSLKEFPQEWDGTNLEQTPFQPLAIVNRLDLAKWNPQSGKWSNAELRFVYGLKGSGMAVPDFTLILEFVLPELTWKQFRTMAGHWLLLSGQECAHSKFNSCVEHLTAAVLQQKPVLTRLRTNSSLGNASNWFLAQWEFRNKSLLNTPLTDQINDKIRRDCVAGSTTPPCPTYLAIWQNWNGAEDIKQWPVDPQSGLLAPHQKYNSYGKGMNTPPGLCNTHPNTRKVLSLQQCSFCHSDETQTRFMHIRNRTEGSGKAELSAFLQGKNPKPSFQKLSTGHPDITHTAVVPFDTFRLDANGQCVKVPKKKPRTFHDLGRRMLFFAMVLLTPSGQQPDQLRINLIQAYAPNFSH